MMFENELNDRGLLWQHLRAQLLVNRLSGFVQYELP